MKLLMIICGQTRNCSHGFPTANHLAIPANAQNAEQREKSLTSASFDKDEFSQ